MSTVLYYPPLLKGFLQELIMSLSCIESHQSGDIKGIVNKAAEKIQSILAYVDGKESTVIDGQVIPYNNTLIAMMKSLRDVIVGVYGGLNKYIYGGHICGNKKRTEHYFVVFKIPSGIDPPYIVPPPCNITPIDAYVYPIGRNQRVDMSEAIDHYRLEDAPITHLLDVSGLSFNDVIDKERSLKIFVDLRGDHIHCEKWKRINDCRLASATEDGKNKETKQIDPMLKKHLECRRRRGDLAPSVPFYVKGIIKIVNPFHMDLSGIKELYYRPRYADNSLACYACEDDAAYDENREEDMYDPDEEIFDQDAQNAVSPPPVEDGN